MATLDEKIQNILVVEDDIGNLAAARAYFSPLEVRGKVCVAYASTLAQAQECMRTTRYDGVITDAFFPTGMDDDKSVRHKLESMLLRAIDILEYRETQGQGLPSELLFEALANGEAAVKALPSGTAYDHMTASIRTWSTGEGLAPAGVLVVQQALEGGIPVILLSSLHHHSDAGEPVYQWCGARGVTYLDGGSEGESKAYDAAHKRLRPSDRVR